MSTEKKPTAANLVWFEIPAEKLDRAKSFYGKIFGWKINPMPGMGDYLHIDTGGGNDTPDGALMARKCPEHPVTIYINVTSAARSAAKVEKLGGKICKAKTAVPGMGYFVICQDTEGNAFALWERNGQAK